jgi:hypothetical protein
MCITFTTFYVSLDDIYTTNTIKQLFLSIPDFWHTYICQKPGMDRNYCLIVFQKPGMDRNYCLIVCQKPGMDRNYCLIVFIVRMSSSDTKKVAKCCVNEKKSMLKKNKKQRRGRSNQRHHIGSCPQIPVVTCKLSWPSILMGFFYLIKFNCNGIYYVEHTNYLTYNWLTFKDEKLKTNLI